MDTIRDRYLEIRERMIDACRKSGRNPDDVKLVVVTKKQPIEKIIQVIEAGANILGENYPEEVVEKIHDLPQVMTPQWHMIGHVQSRKVKFIIQHFSFVHTIDRISVAQKLNNNCETENKILPVLIELNLSGEETKQGYPVSNKINVDLLINDIEEMKSLRHLDLCGLMTMPPLVTKKGDNRAIFERCRYLLEKINKKCDLPGFTQLSMGTSQDYKIAIEEGATFIRIGEAIMGTRQTL